MRTIDIRIDDSDGPKFYATWDSEGVEWKHESKADQEVITISRKLVKKNLASPENLTDNSC